MPRKEKEIPHLKFTAKFTKNAEQKFNIADCKLLIVDFKMKPQDFTRFTQKENGIL